MKEDDFYSKYKKVGQAIIYDVIEDVSEFCEEPYVIVDGDIFSLKWKDEWKGPNLTCFVCKKDLIEPTQKGEVWKCPDKECDSYLGN